MGLHLLGLPAEESEDVSWWDAPEKIARQQDPEMRPHARSAVLEQAELWDTSPKQPAAPPKAEPRREPAAAPAPEPPAMKITKPEPDDSLSTKGHGMSTFKIAKFLQVNGSIFGGAADGRRLALPRGARGRREYQLMQGATWAPRSGRDMQFAPRSLASVTQGRGTTYAA